MFYLKAVKFCPTRRNLLATGGGTGDESIKIWDISAATPNVVISNRAIGQVSGLNFLTLDNSLGIVSSHGYSIQETGQTGNNNSGVISLWKVYEDSLNENNSEIIFLKCLDIHHLHENRILFMEYCSKSNSLATASPDENIKIWDFNLLKNNKFVVKQTNPAANLEITHNNDIQFVSSIR